MHHDAPAGPTPAGAPAAPAEPAQIRRILRLFRPYRGRLALVGLLSATGCLRKEVTHGIYVSPAGVTWSAMEKDVRSDEADPINRLLE